MQDACQSESSGAEIALPNTVILICYFHLKKNVKDRLKGNLKKKIPRTPEQLYPMVLEDISRLHYCRNQIEFQMNLQNVWTKWSQYQDLSNFLNYF